MIDLPLLTRGDIDNLSTRSGSRRLNVISASSGGFMIEGIVTLKQGFIQLFALNNEPDMRAFVSLPLQVSSESVSLGAIVSGRLFETGLGYAHLHHPIIENPGEKTVPQGSSRAMLNLFINSNLLQDFGVKTLQHARYYVTDNSGRITFPRRDLASPNEWPLLLERSYGFKRLDNVVIQSANAMHTLELWQRDLRPSR